MGGLSSGRTPCAPTAFSPPAYRLLPPAYPSASDRRPAAVDRQGQAGDHRRPGGREIEDGGGDLLGRRQAAEGGAAQDIGPERGVLEHRPRQGGVHEGGTDG